MKIRLFFASNLLRIIYLNIIAKGEFNCSVIPPSLKDLVRLTISCLDSDIFRKTQSLNVDKKPNEALWQKAIYSIIMNICASHTVNPEMPSRLTSTPVPKKKKGMIKDLLPPGEKREKKKHGSLDIYIDDKLQWQLEILREGDKLGEHCSRFEPDGKYRFIPRKQWLVVDFRSESSVAFKEQDYVLENTWIVFYNKDFSSYRIYDCEKKEYEDYIKVDVKNAMKLSGLISK